MKMKDLTIVAMNNMKSFKPEVQTGSDPKWYGNALSFATYEEAYANARDLSNRWMLVTNYRAVESDEPVKHTYANGVLENYTA